MYRIRMKKVILILSILALIGYGVFVIIKSEKEKRNRETTRLEYETKISQLNTSNDYYFKQNTDLLSEVKDLKIANEVHRNKRVETKVKWRDKIIIAKAECDTNIINSLDSTYKAAELQCDSSIENLETQVEKLEEVVSNDSLIIVSKDSIITLSTDLIQNHDKQIKKEKRKVLFLKITSIVLAATSLILLL